MSIHFLRNKIKLISMILTAGLCLSACSDAPDTTDESNLTTEVSDTTENSTSEVVAEGPSKSTVDFKEEDLHVLKGEPSDYITVGEYKNIPVDKYIYSYSESDVYEHARSMNSTLITEEGTPAKLGDTVTIDFVGTIDGEAFEGGTASFYTLELGSGTMIPGFEDAIVGMKVGEISDINVTFPEDYRTYGGEKAVFTITLHYITKYTEPTDADLKEAEEEMAKMCQTHSDNEARLSVFDTVMQSTEFPEELPADRYDVFAVAYDNAIAHIYGSKDACIAGNDWTEEDYEADKATYAKANTEKSLLLDYLAKEYDLSFSSEEMQKSMVDQLRVINASEGDMTNEYGTSAEEILYYSSLHEVIANRLLADAEVTEVER